MFPVFLAPFGGKSILYFFKNMNLEKILTRAINYIPKGW